MGLKSILRNRAMNDAIKSNRRRVLFPKLEKIHSIGVICDEGYKVNTDDFKHFNGNTKISYLQYKGEKRNDEQNRNIIFKSDLDFRGLPKKEILHDFVNHDFDILINFASEENEVLSYVYALSKAGFKVSYKSNRNISDLIIEIQEDKRYLLIKELIRTLKNF